MPLENLINLWDISTPFERVEGSIYYPRQRDRLSRIGSEAGINTENVIGAFAALSPNNSEKTTYIALDICILIALEKIPDNSRVPSYPLNREKALVMLMGAEPDKVLSGRKVTAFYLNAMDPENSQEVTVDGHMKNLWTGERLTLKDSRVNVSKSEYGEISLGIRKAAFLTGTPVPAFQASLWLTYKRVNRILWNPQTSFEF